MTIEELKKRRFKLLLDYPHNNHFNIGDILTESDRILDKNAVGKFINKTTGFAWIRNPEKYPKVLMELKWWEERKMEDLPKYFRFLDGITDAPCTAKISDYFGVQKQFSILYLQNSKTEPITDEEYLQENMDTW